MDLNKIKLFEKEELLEKLKRNGFDEAAKIVEDKDVNGQSFIELKELEIFKWRLNITQRKILWNCIEQIKNNPSVLLIQGKPKVVKKPIPIKVKGAEAAKSNKLFKEKLEGSLTTSVGGASILQRIPKNKPVPPKSNENKVFNKPLPSPPPPSPPPKNDFDRKTNNTVRKAVLPLPKESVQQDLDYLEMLPPTRLLNKDTNGDDYPDYLVPTEVSLPINPKNKSPNLTKRIAINESLPKGSGGRNKFHPGKPYAKNVPFNKHPPVEDSEETYENVDAAYELSPPVNINVRNKSPTNTLGQKSSIQHTSEEDARDFKKLPASTSDHTTSIIRKPSIKDLGGLLLVEESQQDTKFSFLASTLKNFITRNKQKNFYENHNIESKKNEPVEMLVKNRPLPEIPLSPEPRPNSLFSKPFPPPREITPDLNPHENYVELINDFPLPKNPSTSRLEIAENLQFYDNAPQHPSSYEQQEIYENTSKREDSLEKQEIYENTSKQPDLDEEQLIYENSASIQEASINKANPNDGHQPPRIHDLASLLQQKLKERTDRQQNVIQENVMQEEKEDTESDSEFDDDLPIYGNISNSKENLSENPNNREDDDYPQKQRFPIYKRTLPEIPKDNRSAHTPPTEIARLPVKKFEQTRKSPNRNFNNSSKDDKQINHSPLRPTLLDTSKLSKSPNSRIDTPLRLGEDKFKRQGVCIQNINNLSREDKPRVSKNPISPRKGSLKDEQPVPSTSTGKSVPVYKNYEHHTTNYQRSNAQKNSKVTNSKEEHHSNSIENIFNLSAEPYFKNIDWKETKLILSKLENGAFLFRPGRQHFLVLTVKHNNEIRKFGIERSSNNTLVLDGEGNKKAPEFSTLRDLVTYFSREPITFERGGKLLKIYLKPFLLHN